MDQHPQLEIYAPLNCTETESLSLYLIRCALTNISPNPALFQSCDWEAIFHELETQTVAGVAVDAVVKLEGQIPDDIVTSWLMYASQVVMTVSEKILSAQNELTMLFERSRIPMAILKGVSAAVNYPSPLCRNMGDIDLMVRKSDLEKAADVLTADGYELTNEGDEHAHHHGFQKGDVIVELHWEPAGIPRGSSGQYLRALFASACDRSIKTDFNGFQYYKLPRLENGLVLILHIVHHLDGGLGLRQICDWYCFVKNELTDEVWYDEFQPILKKVGLENLAVVVTKMCKTYLGLEGTTWSDKADDRACLEFMQFAINKGNFGRKGGQTQRASVFLGTNENDENAGRSFVGKTFRNLQKLGMDAWERDNEKAVGKVKLKPIKCLAWSYLPLRYMRMLMTGERSLRKTKELVKEIKENKSLRDKLGIYESSAD